MLSTTVNRRAGVLFHPSSLPGPYGLGDLGPSALHFLQWMDACGLRIWQCLPINPVDKYGCPYASHSAMAREPMLLSPDQLIEDGWLRPNEKPFLSTSAGVVDWSAVHQQRAPMLDLVGKRIADAVDLRPYIAEHPWSDTWGIFQVVREHLGPDWRDWTDEALRAADPAAVQAFAEAHHHEIHAHIALQWAFDQQWDALKRAASVRGIEIWGDVPLFVSAGSCDVWAHRDHFILDDTGRPTIVSGAPPDQFSPEGQHWGHPHYSDPVHQDTNYSWWRTRFRETLSLFDLARIDHFRGLEAVWQIPVDGDPIDGQWVAGLGAPLLKALEDEFDGLPLFAEDLGIITPAVEQLREDANIPGMAILQFAFGGEANHPYLPHSHRRHQVVYTGTHDNQTLNGWFWSATEVERDLVRRYFSVDDEGATWRILCATWQSVAHTAIVPLQDLLFLGNDCRMNVPGQVEDNWSWRVRREDLTLGLAARHREQLALAGRLEESN